MVKIILPILTVMAEVLRYLCFINIVFLSFPAGWIMMRITNLGDLSFIMAIIAWFLSIGYCLYFELSDWFYYEKGD